MHLAELAGRKVLVFTDGKTILHYVARSIDDLQEVLKFRGEWVDLGGADKQATPTEDGVEAWTRDLLNPIVGGAATETGKADSLQCAYLP